MMSSPKNAALRPDSGQISSSLLTHTLYRLELGCNLCPWPVCRVEAAKAPSSDLTDTHTTILGETSPDVAETIKHDSRSLKCDFCCFN